MNEAQDMGVYIHWPFCLNKCPYCDFNSHVRDRIDQDDFLEAYFKEISYFKSRVPNGRTKSIFFGGGTPSLMEPRLVEALIKRVLEAWPQRGDIEITLEANPSSVEANRFKGYRAAGVNRVSLGVQALNDKDLKTLGRLHNVQEAKKALEIARSTFPRFSFDLIYARPEQSLEGWKSELQEALTMAEGHLSLYQLTIEDGTAFAAAHRKGRLQLPEENLAADMFALTGEMCEGVGLPAYEISNHAKEGEESLHNLIYWRGENYVGIGPGAHGRIMTPKGLAATEIIKKPEGWLKWVKERDTGLLTEQIISSEDRAIENLMMGLRLRCGIDKKTFEQNSGHSIDKVISSSSKESLKESGFLDETPSVIKLTQKGRPLLNSILKELLV